MDHGDCRQTRSGTQGGHDEVPRVRPDLPISWLPRLPDPLQLNALSWWARERVDDGPDLSTLRLLHPSTTDRVEPSVVVLAGEAGTARPSF